jgi:predicted RNA-binding protein Jag
MNTASKTQLVDQIDQQENLAVVTEQSKQLLHYMGFDQMNIQCTCKETKDKYNNVQYRIHVEISAGDTGRILIGARGSNLSALQHVLRSVMRQYLSPDSYLTLDINGYLAAKEKSLLYLAEEAARKVGHTGRAIVLPPMEAAQRRTIHTSLASRQEIHTESLGDEPNRRVVVRPTYI